MGNETAKEETRERSRTLDPRRNLSVDATLKYDKNPSGGKAMLQDINKPPQRNRRQSLNNISSFEDSVANVLD